MVVPSKLLFQLVDMKFVWDSLVGVIIEGSSSINFKIWCVNSVFAKDECSSK